MKDIFPFLLIIIIAILFFYLLRMLGCDFSGDGSYEPRDWFRGL